MSESHPSSAPTAIQLLAQLGLLQPTSQQINLMGAILSTSILKEKTMFDAKLTPNEQLFLFWIAQGKTLEEAGDLVGITTLGAYEYHTKIRQKLNCRTISQAVFEGMRLGYLAETQATQSPVTIS